MKHHVLILIGIVLTIGLKSAQAQCTPDPNCVDTENPGQMCPDTLDDAYLNIPYEEVVTIIPPDSFTLGETVLHLSHIKIISIGNMPPGIDFETNAPNNLFAIGTKYCAKITGTPTVVGDFQLEVNIKPYLSLNEPLPFVVTDDTSLMVTVHLEQLSINDYSGSQFQCELYPNPFTDQFMLNVQATSNNTGRFYLHDATGRLVQETALDIRTGMNEFIINTKELPGGIYYYRIQNGMKILSNKIIKQ